MKTISFIRVVGVLGLLAAAAAASAQDVQPQVFAKEAVPLDFRCGDPGTPSREFKWGEATLTLKCNGSSPDAPIQATYLMGVVEATEELTTDIPGWRPSEILWFGNGRSFLVNGIASSTAGHSFIVYRNDGTALKRGDITGPARKAMYDKLVKCWSQMKKTPEFNDRGYSAFNMLGLSWHDEGRAIVVYAKVVAGSKYGAATGETLGFEIDSRSGSVLRTLPAADFKERWQPVAGWTIRVPEPAKCGKLFPSAAD